MIPDEDLPEGIGLCWRNTRFLVDDAWTLYRRRSYGHAMALAIIALEEFSKLNTLEEADTVAQAARSGHRDYRADYESEVRAAFKSHKIKLANTLDFVKGEIEEALRKDTYTLRRVLGEAPTDEEIGDLTKSLRLLRASGLYVDYTESRKWFDPNSPTLRETALKTLRIADWIVKTTEKRLRILHGF